MEFGCLRNQPIFQGGRLKSNVRLTEAQREQMRLTYEQTIQGAFRDVSNGVIGYRKNREFRVQQEHLLESAQDAARLSEVRFKAGTTDYLEVLTNETNSFSAELGLAQAQSNELISLVQIYQTLVAAGNNRIRLVVDCHGRGSLIIDVGKCDGQVLNSLCFVMACAIVLAGSCRFWQAKSSDLLDVTFRARDERRQFFCERQARRASPGSRWHAAFSCGSVQTPFEMVMREMA
jgi:hypothetical protein